MTAPILKKVSMIAYLQIFVQRMLYKNCVFWNNTVFGFKFASLDIGLIIFNNVQNWYVSFQKMFVSIDRKSVLLIDSKSVLLIDDLFYRSIANLFYR